MLKQTVIFRQAKLHIQNLTTDVLLNGNILNRISSTKFLGVIFEGTLSWSKHLTYMKSQLSNNIGIITKAKWVFEPSTLILLYYAFIYSNLIYCIESWGSTFLSHLTPLFKLQKNILRIIKSVPQSFSSSVIFDEYKIMTIFYIWWLFCHTDT